MKFAQRSGDAWLLSSLRVLWLLFWSLVVLVPLLIFLRIALAPQGLATDFLTQFTTFRWANFSDAWNVGSLGTAMISSLVVTGLTCLIVVVLGATTAYPLARRSGRLYTILYNTIIAGLVLPPALSAVVLYREMQSFNLVDSWFGLAILSAAGNFPFVVFLYTGFIKSVPRELEEAAFIDGAGPFRVFWNVVFPLLRPISATVVITTCLAVWNDFLYPLIFLQSPEKQTLPLAMYAFVGERVSNWQLIFAGITISTIPMIILFLFLQRYFVAGLAEGAVKG